MVAPAAPAASIAAKYEFRWSEFDFAPTVSIAAPTAGVAAKIAFRWSECNFAFMLIVSVYFAFAVFLFSIARKRAVFAFALRAEFLFLSFPKEKETKKKENLRAAPLKIP